jgi:alpha-tubulin suppressor-like RCC1 family protein
VVAWGSNTSGQSTVPASATGVIAISAGSNHTLVLKADGSLVCWGANGAGQCTIP